jgi:hypothetical protein
LGGTTAIIDEMILQSATNRNSIPISHVGDLGIVRYLLDTDLISGKDDIDAVPT